MVIDQRVPRAIHEAVIEDVRSTLRGELLKPGDHGYNTARTVWNGMVDRHPALLARCRGAADVIASVNFAREQGCLSRSVVAGITLPATPCATAA